MRFPRGSGILLHPTSLPGPFGLGDLGPEAWGFLKILARCGQRVWQVLPLGPTGYGESPYQSPSAFAGNPLLISVELLVRGGLLERTDLARASFPEDRVDFRKVTPWRAHLLGKAFEAFRAGRGGAQLRARFEEFRQRESEWAEDFALFCALKQAHAGRAWTRWPHEYRDREPGALERARRKLAGGIERVLFEQFLFFDQWEGVRACARELGVEILGDLPIFVSADSADVWVHRALFDLREDGRPRAMAGVPPDYFSATGQRWGNPLYRWEVHRRMGYGWWIQRMRAALRLYDRVRIDHFRGFADYWEIPASEKTAVKGRWVQGPGAEFFETLTAALGELPVVAEDLGQLSEAVPALRERFEFPGMRVLQYAFGPDPRDDFHAPHAHVRNCVVYTGTHDNDTTRGWFEGGKHTTEREEERRARRARVLRYLGTDGSEIHWDLIRLAFISVADTAVVPMQDVLGLGSEARMNVPGRAKGNWRWRLERGLWREETQDRLAELTEAAGRWKE